MNSRGAWQRDVGALERRGAGHGALGGRLVGELEVEDALHSRDGAA
jgi:hypothetical protein